MGRELESYVEDGREVNLSIEETANITLKQLRELWQINDEHFTSKFDESFESAEKIYNKIESIKNELVKYEYNKKVENQKKRINQLNNLYNK